jgi:hypothetical protein
MLSDLRAPLPAKPLQYDVNRFVLATASRTKYLYGRHSGVLINDGLHVQSNKVQILYIQSNFLHVY